MNALCSLCAALVTLMAWAVFAVVAVSPHPSFAQDTLSEGEYIFNLAGCEGCHTDKKSDGQR
ncbi:MAG: hypothetical protein JKY27_00095 [Magnetovibrio sp.]|nr:hypothetical protein [Magnetovibrio sp.]